MKRLVSVALGIGVVAGLVACAGQEKPNFPGEPARAIDTRGRVAGPVGAPAPRVDPFSLYARLGQRAGIEAVMTDFVTRAATDRRIARRFAKTDAKALIANLTDQLCQASGGPCKYTGKDMKTAHRGMRITNREWNITGGHVVAAMKAKNVPAKEQQEVLAILTPMRKDIVGQ